LNGERVKQAIQEHGIYDHPHIWVLKRHVGLSR